jgi:SAM-dependent methyltransferase
LYGEKLADVWDIFYRIGRGKDYVGEAEQVAGAIKAAQPCATSLLDVGCGTGEHLASLSRIFAHVEGVDISPAMATAARAKLPGIPIHVADMRRFSLGRKFDAVISMNTAVAYLPSLRAFCVAIRRMSSHITPGGVLIVEPWWFRDRFIDGYVAADVIEVDGRSVARMSRTERRADRAVMDIHYVLADERNIEHFTETHSFGLWSLQDYIDAFAMAGCSAEYVSETISGYGMFIARPRASEAASVAPSAGRSTVSGAATISLNAGSAGNGQI